MLKITSIPDDIDKSFPRLVQLASEYINMASLGKLISKDITVEYRKSFIGLRSGKSGFKNLYYLNINLDNQDWEESYKLYIRYTASAPEIVVAATEAFAKIASYITLLHNDSKIQYRVPEAKLGLSESLMLEYMTHTIMFKAMQEGFPEVGRVYIKRIVKQSELQEEQLRETLHRHQKDTVTRLFEMVITSTVRLMAASNITGIGVTIPNIPRIKLSEIVIYIRDKVNPTNPTSENLNYISQWAKNNLDMILY